MSAAADPSTDDAASAESGKEDTKNSSSVAATSRELGGIHSFLVNMVMFTVDKKYSPLKSLGVGAYGMVCSALNKATGEKVAIKKIPKAFHDKIDAKRVLREVKLLQHFRHPNIVGLRDMVPTPRGYPFDDVYMVMDLMETDLHKIIYSKNVLTDEHIQYFIYQTLRALKYIHSANVIHRDLKPSNLLLNSNCELKICDFGLARGVSQQEDYELTEYVVTRWYRAPEVMVSSEYDAKIDVWAVGCILAELHGRQPLFPGDNYLKQIDHIFSILGTPKEDDMGFITQEAQTYIKRLEPKEPTPLSRKFKNATPIALDLMEKMLKFNPAKRISVDEALAHPYFKSLHNPAKEITCEEKFDFAFEREEMDFDQLREFFWDETFNFRQNLRPEKESLIQQEKHVRETRDRAKQSETGRIQPANSGEDTSSPSGTKATE